MTTDRVSLAALDDHALVGLAQAGTADAFATLYERHRAHVATAIRCTATLPPETTDDLVSETFLRAFTALGGYHVQAGHSFAGWMTTIARHLVVDWLRQRGRRPSVSLEEGIAQYGDWFEDQQAAAPLLAVEAACDLAPVLGALTPRQRDVVRRHWQQDQSLTQVAQAWQCAPSTAKAAHHSAMHRLRAVLMPATMEAAA